VVRQHPQGDPETRPVTGTAKKVSPMETIDFGGLEIAFDERVLRPRAWTTAQSRWASALLPHLPAGDVLELCSGAGQIGLLAVAKSSRRLVCVDASPVAASYTMQNAAAAGCASRVSVREGLIREAIGPDERFPMIIADPPWVPRAETGRFPEDPPLAIDGGDDGLHVVRECIRAIDSHLGFGGAAVLQLGTVGQVASVTALLDRSDLLAGDARRYGDRGVLLRIDRIG
jgi:methylase of polypeptide subunit release factors